MKIIIPNNKVYSLDMFHSMPINPTLLLKQIAEKISLFQHSYFELLHGNCTYLSN